MRTFNGHYVKTRQDGLSYLADIDGQESPILAAGQRAVRIIAESPAMRAVQVYGLVLGLCLAGCSTGQVSETSQAPSPTATPMKTPNQSEEETATERAQWISLFLHDSKIGYGMTRFVSVDIDGQAYLEGTLELKIRLRRFGEETEQTMRLTSTETLDGQLIRFESYLGDAGGKRVSRGEQSGGRLRIESVTGSHHEEKTVDWPPDTGGFFALERSFRQQPPSPGQSRHLSAIIPILNQIAQMEVEARDWEETDVLGEKRLLLRVEARTRLPNGSELPQTMWLDDEGRVIKTYQPGLEQTTYQTTQSDARKMPKAVDFDLGTHSMVPLAKPLVAPHKASWIVYRVRLDRENPSEVFSNGGSQQVRSLDRHTAELRVIAVRPDRPPQRLQSRSPESDDLTPNSLIECDDPQIVALSRQVVPDESDTWKIAKALETHVHQLIDKKDFSQAFATAAQTAASRQGDCTEHAVLLAALCRARKIPARVAIGLVYHTPGPGFVYHMWNEVWIQDRWVPLDATLGLGGIGGGHIKINDSNLSGSSAYSCFLPVVQVLGQLHLEVLKIE